MTLTEGIVDLLRHGMAALLPFCAHVIVDAGPERGPDLVVPAPAVINYMLARGFEVAQIKGARRVVAFGNRDPVSFAGHGAAASTASAAWLWCGRRGFGAAGTKKTKKYLDVRERKP